MKKPFQQAMVSESFPRSSFAGGGELNAMMLFIKNQRGAAAGKFLKHSGHRGCPDAEPLRYRVGEVTRVPLRLPIPE